MFIAWQGRRNRGIDSHEDIQGRSELAREDDIPGKQDQSLANKLAPTG